MIKQSELRLFVKIASLYYEDGLNQAEIAQTLNLSQSFISRAIKRCHNEKIVRVSIDYPVGTFISLERDIQKKYNIKQAIIVDADKETSSTSLKRAVGSAAARYLQNTIASHQLVGISSWSTFVSAMVDALYPHETKAAGVIQILGGVGHNRNLRANMLADNLANILNCPAYPLPTTSGVQSLEEKSKLLKNPEISEVVNLFPKVDIAIVGIGTSEPSDLIRNLGIIYKEETQEELKTQGAVGDICLHYYDINGKPIVDEDNDLVISMTLPQLKTCSEVVAIVGGLEKAEAIRGAMAGGYIDVLVTDRITAQYLNL